MPSITSGFATAAGVLSLAAAAAALAWLYRPLLLQVLLLRWMTGLLLQLAQAILEAAQQARDTSKRSLCVPCLRHV
jgi:hypothetical protein